MDIHSLRIEAAVPGDEPALTLAMTRAFDDDSRRHLGKDKGGPPGYDTGEFIRKNGFDPRARAFKATIDGKIAGCVIVFPQGDGHHWLGCMFTDPACQRVGVGKRMFDHVEREIPGKSWTLETPAFASSNHRFYEDRCGFKKIREGYSADGLRQFIYRKEYC